MVMTNNWKAQSVLVTGATGIVGSSLVSELLDKECKVHVLIRDWDPQSRLMREKLVNRCTVINGDLEDYRSVERAINEHDIETVFHLGAQTIVGTALRSPLSTFESNIRGSYNLLEACRVQSSLVKRVIVASSDKAYGESPTLPYTEEQRLEGKHPYDVSKSCTDLLAQTYHHTYNLPVAIARCGNIYGEGDLNWSRIVPGTIRSVLSGQDILIRSDGSFLRDYVYVQDVVSAYMVLADHLHRPEVRGGSFNFGPAKPLSVLEITHKILETMKKPDHKIVVQNIARAEIKDQYLNSEKARSILDWGPRYSLEEGLLRTVRWYTEFLGQT